MTDAAPAIFVALEASSIGAAIRQSTWLYLTANVGHIVSLVVFAGAVAVMDLRMAGAFKATSPGYVLHASRRVAIAAFLGLIATGSILFTAEASHVVINPVFQLKLALIALGLINVLLFEIFTAPRVREIPPLKPLPGAARAAGIISIGVWIAVAACGRTIAYF
jgi:uncharacterized membrane protein